MRFMSVVVALLIVMVLGAPATAHAQDPRGAIEGRVVDESGGALPGANVGATNTATGIAAVAVTNTEGRYQLPFLAPGIYRLLVDLQGFRTVQRDKVEVRV